MAWPSGKSEALGVDSGAGGGEQFFFAKKNLKLLSMGRINFIELPARDLRAATAFYGNVFGWELTDFGPSYACTMTGDVDVGLQGDPGEAPAAPLPVVAVDDLQAALIAVEQAGGTITRPIFAFPGGRRFHFKDPNGLELAIMQSEPAP